MVWHYLDLPNFRLIAEAVLDIPAEDLARVAIDRLPSGSFRGRLMINGQRCTATLPTEAGVRLWELETRGAAARRRRAMLATFGAYAAGWLAGFIDDAPDRARFETAPEHRLLPVLGQFPPLEVLDADRDELHRQLVDAGGAGERWPHGRVPAPDPRRCNRRAARRFPRYGLR